ncbi:hypothetical protein J2I47_10225 [Fibrella sp. HMF5335]|uniref:Chain length determinant protein n=1 Tax=Fibrella rubiginis TaxID=2817060 RepID=A0A939GG87_9BACT|nr:hypothetical protein [Fibrella rubiginis]MBO0936920.1 hypothetical protein [Fibrella rubiginis]
MTPTTQTGNNAMGKTLPPDQISPKAVVARAAKIRQVIRRNWYILIAAIALGLVIGYIIDATSTKKTTYSAKIVFNLGGGGGGGGLGSMGDIGALASAFGVGQAAPDANIFSGENFIQYAKSRPVVEKTLMKTVKINGQDTLLVNYYIAHSGIREKEWEKSKEFENYHFPRAKTRDEYTKDDNTAMAIIYERLLGELSIKGVDRKSSFMALGATTEHELLSKALVENHIETIEADYRKKQTKKTREMLTMLSDRVDSLGRVMTGTENKLARYMNENQQVIVAQNQINEGRLQRNSSFLTSQYYGALTQLDNMKLSLIREQPLFTIIEDVYLPLYKEVPGKIGTQAGVAIGLVLGVVAIFLRETLSKVGKE